jgi:hypothetical protein
MTEMDEWGKDPSVQFMRKVFREMECVQHELLKRLDITPYDPRIRRWREQALALFERAWGIAYRMGTTVDEQMASVVYVHCLAKIVGVGRIKVPTDIMPDAKRVEGILKEAFQ